MNVFWYMCAPDGAYPWQPEGSRKVDLGYYKQLALAYDQLGYTGALFATGAHDVWVLAGALLSYTERLKFLVAIHPGLVAPTLLAKMAATLQEFSRGRLLINVVSGDAKMLGAYGMTMPHDERYDMADEYLQIWHRLLPAKRSISRGGISRRRAQSWRCRWGRALSLRHCGLAAPRTRPSMSRPSMSRPIFPGVKRRTRSARRSISSRRGRRSLAVSWNTAFVSMLLCVIRMKRHGPPPPSLRAHG